jgi:hypothetical protein
MLNIAAMYERMADRADNRDGAIKQAARRRYCGNCLSGGRVASGRLTAPSWA